MTGPGPVQLAGTAQRMINILFLSCPANYSCGGPAYAAQSSLDSILHLMGIGVAILQRSKSNRDTTEYEKGIRQDSVCGPTIIKGFVQHKSQILGGALHSVLSNLRDKQFRECPEVTREAMLMLMQYYFDKSGDSKEEFWIQLLKNDHDELIQVERATV